MNKLPRFRMLVLRKFSSSTNRSLPTVTNSASFESRLFEQRPLVPRREEWRCEQYEKSMAVRQ